jgi:hypothetical protein
MEALGEENDVRIAKMAWLSLKEHRKGVWINGNMSHQKAANCCRDNTFTLQESQPTPESTSRELARRSVTDVK